jgi:hypothetical protein
MAKPNIEKIIKTTIRGTLRIEDDGAVAMEVDGEVKLLAELLDVFGGKYCELVVSLTEAEG